MRTRARTSHPRHAERGMTLLELLVVLAILSIASDAIFSVLYASLKTYWKGDAATQVQQSARISTDRMLRDVRQAGNLINNVTKTVGATTITFNTSCTTPQISFVLPHLNPSLTLSDGTTIYAPDANASGVIPYAGWYASYYLAGAPNSATPNTTGPYLIRASYDGSTMTVATVAGNITALAFNPSGTCPTTASREFTVQITSFQFVTSTAATSQAVVTDDVAFRNPAMALTLP